MIWKLPEGVKPSNLTTRKADQRPALEQLFLTRTDDPEWYELAGSNAYIFGRFLVYCQDGEGAPDEVRVSYDAMKVIERADARAFTLHGPEDFVRPVSAATNELHPIMFQQPAAPPGGVPRWPDLTSSHTPSSEAFAFGVNPVLLDRLGRGLGARQGLRLEPGSSPLRAIKVNVLGASEREGLIMPIRLNV